ncbi:uncharacterized protein PAC_12402 [Phialocephala subalpina]|uniref:Uncharacterized protein n=1 Tax=Phialocephala subalpina TaxID=576137 RepID=A0A1L7XBX2_9HELO|nr:uncharacterized protein PAC_12402 [Phialocephala subalpina]
MAKCRLGILAFLVQIVALVGAVTWDAAPSTTFDAQTLATETRSQTPSATPAPDIVINGTMYEPANLCGYVEYSSVNSYTCGGDNTCLWNSNLRLVGCGNTASVNYYTSCVPWRHIQDCNSSCLADPSILRCSTPTPYCVTPIIGPHHNYSIFGCEATHIFGRYKVHLTYSGQTTTGHLPRYLGKDSIITYGTKIPKNSFLSLSNTTTTLTQDPFLVATISTTDSSGRPTGVGRGNWANASEHGSEWRGRWEQQQLRTEIIAGSVIGGFMFLIAVGLLFWLFFAWRRLKRLKAQQGAERKDVQMQEMGRESVITSEASTSISGLVSRGSRRMSEHTVSIGEVAPRDRGRGSVGSPTVSEVGSGYISRGTSTTLELYDELYDDEDDVGRGRRRTVPTVVLVPAEEPEDPNEEEAEDEIGVERKEYLRPPDDFHENHKPTTERQDEVEEVEHFERPDDTPLENDQPPAKK